MNRPASFPVSDTGPVGHAVFTEGAWTAIARSLHLSPRELQISKGIFDDRKESAIASDLGISPHTVHTHLERLYTKLAVRSRVELVVCLTAVHNQRYLPNT